MKRAAFTALLALRICGQTVDPGAPSEITHTLEAAPVISAPVSVFAPRSVAAVSVAPGRRWRFAHPGTAVLAGLRLKGLRKSTLIEQWLGLIPGAGTDQLIAPFLEDIDEAYISLDGNRKSTQPIILLIGKFRSAKVRQALQLPDEAATTGAVLLGEAAAVTAAKRRVRTPATVQAGKLVDRAFELSPFHDFWIAGEAAGLSGPELLQDVTSFTLGINLREVMTADLQIFTASPAAGTNLLALLEAARSKARSTIEGKEAWDQLTRDLKIEQRPDGLRFHLQIDPARIPASTAQRLTGKLPVTPSGRPARRSVVIQGQEGGAREIPYSQPR